MAKTINTFNQGMDRDSSKNKYDNTHYYDARNMRLTSQEGLSGGALENLRGAALRVNIRGGATSFIVGHVVLGDYVVVWTTTNQGAPNGASTDSIYKIPIATLDALSGAGTFTFDDATFHTTGDLIYTGNLWLSTTNLIVAIARYDNASVQKVYWVDTYNRLRHINTVYNADTNDLVNMDESMLEAIGDISLTQPEIIDIVGGNLKAGRVQYAYQLYALHGAETIFSPISDLVNLAAYPDVSSTSEDYRGSDIDDNSGKAVKGSIEVGIIGYTRMRIVAIHYSSLAGEPSIRILEEREISGALETVYFTDTGSSVGSLILEDIRTTGTLLFTPNELETKDNILFPANITEESFDVTYDARAYRFGGANDTSTAPNYNAQASLRGVARVYQEDDTYYDINGSTKAVTGTAPSASGSWTALDEEIDAINKFNDLDNDGNHLYRFMYQADGIVPGGEGPNISYLFKIKEIVIDDATVTRERLYTSVEGTVDNPSYTSYASPYVAAKYVGYNRDETYRFGIVFFDDKGRSSFVKWIGDIRMPSISTLANQVQYNAGGGAPTPQIGDVTVNSAADVLYRITVDGIYCAFQNDPALGGPGFTNVTSIGNALRNVMVTNLSHLASFTANVGGTWQLTFDQTYGQYTITEHDSGFYVGWAHTQAYAPGVGASSDYSIAWNDGTDTIGNILYPEFTVSNIPAGVESYQIVRVKREALDRSVMAQGVVGLVTAGVPQNWDDAAGSDLYTFASPEVAFNKNLSRQGSDFLQEVGEFNDNLNVGGAGTDLVLYNYHTVIPMNNPQLQEIAGAGSALGDEHETASKTDIVAGQIVAQDQVEANIGTTTFLVKNAANFTDKGISFVFEADNTTWRSKNKPYTHASDGRKLINYRRNIFATQYGGVSYNNRRQNLYIAASEISNLGASVNAYGGDTYIGMFDYLYSSWEDGVVASTQPEVLYFPVETSINLPLRLDDCYHRTYGSANSDHLHETAGVWTNGAAIEFPQTNDLYRYNTVYSKENDTKLFIKAPFDWSSETSFPVRTRASLVKTTNELADSWLIFGANALKDVDPQYGEITRLITLNDKLMFFQPKAFGILSVNERALLQTSQISQLSLGTSGILDRYDYAKINIGASDTRHVLQTPNGLYWIDTINKAMYKYSGGPEEVSLMKGLDHYFRTALVNGSTTFLFHDPEFKEVYVNDYTANWSLVYNELIDSFIGFNDFFPDYVINYNDKVYGTRDGYQFYRHNDVDANRGHLYGTYYPTSVTLLVNPDNENIAIYNNLEWLTEALTQAGDDTEITFTNITMYNDYQHSGVITFSASDLKRRMRKWRHVIRRAVYEADGITPLNRRDARFRDSHLFVKLEYVNDANDRKFVSHDIITSYRTSNT